MSTINFPHKTIEQRHWQRIIDYFPHGPFLLSKAEWCFLSLTIQLLRNYRRAELCPFTVCRSLFLIRVLNWQSPHIERQLFSHNKGLYKLSSVVEEVSQYCRYGDYQIPRNRLQIRLVANPVTRTRSSVGSYSRLIYFNFCICLFLFASVYLFVFMCLSGYFSFLIIILLYVFPPAACSDGLAAGFQSGAAVPGLCAGWVCPPTPQFLVRLRFSRR